MHRLVESFSILHLSGGTSIAYSSSPGRERLRNSQLSKDAGLGRMQSMVVRPYLAPLKNVSLLPPHQQLMLGPVGRCIPRDMPGQQYTAYMSAYPHRLVVGYSFGVCGDTLQFVSQNGRRGMHVCLYVRHGDLVSHKLN